MFDTFDQAYAIEASIIKKASQAKKIANEASSSDIKDPNQIHFMRVLKDNKVGLTINKPYQKSKISQD